MNKSGLFTLGLIYFVIMLFGIMLEQLDNALITSAEAAEQGKWVKKADMNTPRAQFATAVVDGKIYAVGGIIDLSFNITETVEEYDPIKDKWTKKSSMPIAKMSNYGISVVNGIIYSIGGSDLNKLGNTVYAYDPSTDTWTKKADMPTPRENLCTAVANGKIYAIGGIGAGLSNANECLKSVDEYDPVKDTWSKKSDMPEYRDCCGAATFNNKIYVLGGENCVGTDWGPPAPEVLEYDPVADRWAKRSMMPTPRIGAGVSLLDDKIYAIGGFSDPNTLTPLATVEIYEPLKDAWSKDIEILRAKNFPCCNAVDGKIYVIGGYKFEASFEVLSEVEEYEAEYIASGVNPNGKIPKIWGNIKSTK